jgi:alpha-beta hydrolase superfamily lysophospholipase
MLVPALKTLTGVARYSVLVGFTALVAVTLVDALSSRRLPELSIWHRVELTEEFDRHREIADFAAYVELEERLFDQLNRDVVELYEPSFAREMNRYVPGSMADPARFSHNYNRSYERVPERPRGAVVLLHGLTDSPYSLHQMSAQFYHLGFHVVALRLPGHGTIPGALTEVDWEDWSAATRLAITRASENLSAGQPLYVAGYSTGAALALDYVVDDLLADAQTRIDRLLLFSPAIGVSPLIQLANLHRLIAGLPWFEKAPWISVVPEFNPFKYQSFSKNGAWQVRRLTRQLEGKLDTLFEAGGAGQFPSVLTVMSMVDATVSVSSVVDLLMGRLPHEHHELMLFDVNHEHRAEGYMRPVVVERIDALFSTDFTPYRRTLLTNRDSHSLRVEALTFCPGGQVVATPTDLSWPANLFSLSHVALLFPEDDPLYGVKFREDRVSLGAFDLKGEFGLLQMSDSQLMRLRYNPFYGYIEQRLAALAAQDLSTASIDGWVDSCTAL